MDLHGLSEVNCSELKDVEVHQGTGNYQMENNKAALRATSLVFWCLPLGKDCPMFCSISGAMVDLHPPMEITPPMEIMALLCVKTHGVGQIELGVTEKM